MRILLIIFVAAQISPAQMSGLKVIRENCLSCHSGDKPVAGLRVDSVDNMVRGGIHGPAVVPFRPDKSLLYKYIIPQDGAGPICPPFKRLSEAKTEAIRLWIYNGALQMSMSGQEP